MDHATRGDGVAMSAHTANDFAPTPLRALMARCPALDPASVPDWTVDDTAEVWAPRCAECIIETYGGRLWLFTARTPAGALVLCYRCDLDDDGEAFILTPTSPEVVTALDANRVPLRDVVEVPWMALVWVSWADEVQSACVVQPGDIPGDHLPTPGTLLHLR